MRFAITRIVFYAGIAIALDLAANDKARAAANDPASAWTITFAPAYFYWHESDGGTIIDESGAQFGLQAAYRDPVERGWLMTGRAKAYYAAADYTAPGGVSTTSHYMGGLGEFGGGYRWETGSGRHVDLIGDLGIEDWERTFVGFNNHGENWLPIYLKGGIESSPKDNGWIGAVGLKLPVYTIEQVDFSFVGFGTVTLHPATRPSGYAEGGYRFNRHLSVAAFFDSYWFGQDTTTKGGGGFVQPSVFTFQAGLNVGWTF